MIEESIGSPYHSVCLRCLAERLGTSAVCCLFVGELDERCKSSSDSFSMIFHHILLKYDTFLVTTLLPLLVVTLVPLIVITVNGTGLNLVVNLFFCCC